MRVYRKIIVLAMCLFLGGTIVEADKAPEAPAQAGGELFAAYIYASQRVGIWTDYAAAIASEGKSIEVKRQFGLVSAEEAQTWTDRKTEANRQLQLAKQLRDSASAKLASGYPWSAGALAGTPQAAAVQADAKLAASLQQALQSQKKAKGEVESAAWMFKSGLADSLLLLGKEDSYKQANLAATAAKETYTQSILASYAAANASPMKVSALMAALKRGPIPALAGEWLSALSPYLKPLLAKSKISYPIKNGEVGIPLRLIAEELGYRVMSDKTADRIQLTRSSNSIVIYPKQQRMTKNERQYPLAEALFTQNNITYVPLSFLCDAFGLEAVWRDADQQVLRISPIIGKDGSS
ncbi:copper amine oxidase N-terminal domain-containing protein [Paenibacillus sacheonensis]|uniref:Copper amine oxidase-like N-terminal domain-containing protein n=1 Tax=Paenibacillus sacheonensis TaxID=742054 RepID=A0A7X5BXF7_9BACL|nr:copper amine oxidase N-terminal domain-containing protein [Paenibacillus sacheonensis]MBM7568276.1 hypothetical protein [Paenibacillus sacheonensis]NBC68537.1 hypothetical protein [Paenibacillus sacheonensis]